MSTVIDSISLIRRLRELRQIQGLSAQNVADATGIPRSVIANMESGRRAGISVDEAAAICEALSVDLRAILSPEPMPVARQVWVI